MKRLNKLKQNLPQEPGILDKESKYFNSAVLVPLLLKDNSIKVLFQRRQKGMRQEDDICFPGGRYEPDRDNNYENTVHRETEEEIGVNKDKIDIIGRLDTIVAPMGATVDIFVGSLNIKGLEEIEIQEEEVSEIFTLSLEKLKDIEPEKYEIRLEIQPERTDEKGEKQVYLPADELNLPEKYSTPWGGKKYRVFVYKTSKGIIWGITGEIVNNLLKHC